MNEMVDRVLELTKSKMFIWQKAERDINEHLEEQRLKSAFLVTGFAPCAGRTFRGVYIGLRGKEKVLCAAIVDDLGNWHYIDAKNDSEKSVKDLFLVVKKMISNKDACRNCEHLKKSGSENEVRYLERMIKSKDKVIENKDRVIARNKRKILRLRAHLAALGVGKKPFRKI